MLIFLRFCPAIIRLSLRQKTALRRVFILYFSLLFIAALTPAQAIAKTNKAHYKLQEHLLFGDPTDKLDGDLYSPDKVGTFPALVAVHGGDWRFADSKLYQHWGPFLAKHGYVVFSINYRLANERGNFLPTAADDVQAAVRFLRKNASRLHIDPNRIGVMGDSAGAHLASLAALSANQSRSNEVDSSFKVCIAVYGVYDLAAQYNFDLQQNPDDNIVQVAIGKSLQEDPQAYQQASPLYQIKHADKRLQFFLIWGDRDERVDATSQSVRFASALKHAGFKTQTLILKNATHYWMSEALLTAKEKSKTPNETAYLAPHLLKFLKQHL
jgi:acetyl esterase/lipase